MNPDFIGGNTAPRHKILAPPQVLVARASVGEMELVFLFNTEAGTGSCRYDPSVKCRRIEVIDQYDTLPVLARVGWVF